jgi:manganese/zinc/iron transport system ATP- binding protein
MNNQQEIALEIQGLTASYDGVAALQQVTVSARAGRVVGILGPNGAGKSTLLKAALGLLPVDAGQARFFGAPLAQVRRRVVYVPQRSAVDWDFPVTVEDVVLMGRDGRRGLFGRPSREDRAIAARSLEQLGLSGLGRRQIGELSGGQQQRVFLARALAQEGDLLLMDEPFVGVDAATEEAIVALMRDLRDRGGAVVVVNHDLQTAQRYFDDLWLLNKALVAHGPTAEVFTPALLSRAYGGRLAVVEDGAQQWMIAA